MNKLLEVVFYEHVHLINCLYPAGLNERDTLFNFKQIKLQTFQGIVVICTHEFRNFSFDFLKKKEFTFLLDNCQI